MFSRKFTEALYDAIYEIKGRTLITWNYLECLDRGSELDGCSLVTLSTNPKVFSNGMDLINIEDENFY